MPMASTILPITLPDELRLRIEKLAERSEKLASLFVETVLREALDYDEALEASVARGLDDVAAGRTLTTAQLLQRVDEKIASIPDKR